MPQIEHIEVATGNYPPVANPKKRCIFIITKGTGDDYVMEYSDTRIKELSNYLFDEKDLKFTTDSNVEKRNIVKKEKNDEVDKDHVFKGATNYE